MSNQMTDEYKMPEIYESEQGKWSKDFPFFCTLIAKGEALDLACGTGRLAGALAKSGLSCTGLDGSSEMIAFACEKSIELDISYLQGDMRDFSLDQKFDLITLSGNSFQALLTDDDQDNMFDCVKKHLKPSGVFAFNSRNPTPEELTTSEEFTFWHEFTDLAGNLVKVFGKQKHEASKKLVHYVTKRIWSDHKTISEITLRFTSAATICTKLKYLGFEIIDIYGDFDKKPFTAKSSNIIVVCRLKI